MSSARGQKVELTQLKRRLDYSVSLKLEDYGFVGDTHTAALIGMNGSIDWMCLPRFDSAACFAALLGEEQNGCWRIAPAEPWKKVSHAYRQRHSYPGNAV